MRRVMDDKFTGGSLKKLVADQGFDDGIATGQGIDQTDNHIVAVNIETFGGWSTIGIDDALRYRTAGL